MVEGSLVWWVLVTWTLGEERTDLIVQQPAAQASMSRYVLDVLPPPSLARVWFSLAHLHRAELLPLISWRRNGWPELENASRAALSALESVIELAALCAELLSGLKQRNAWKGCSGS